MKKRLLTLLLAAMLLTLSGCAMRVRVPEAAPPDAVEEPAPTEQPDQETPPVEAEEEAEEAPPVPPSEEPDPTAATVEDPEATRREYAEEGNGEVSPQAQQLLAPAEEPETDTQPPAAAVEVEQAEQTVTEHLAAEEAEDLAADEAGEQADSALQYYQALLISRLEPLFECKRAYVYWETETDHETIHKSSPEHQVLTLSGAYDVAVKLLEDALTVDDGWVFRKNPGGIVKGVDGTVLGSGVTSTAAAEAVAESLRQREELSQTQAGQKGTVILLSQTLLRSIEGQTAAAVYLASALYPELFSDIDPNEAADALLKGVEAAGLYAYIG